MNQIILSYTKGPTYHNPWYFIMLSRIDPPIFPDEYMALMKSLLPDHSLTTGARWYKVSKSQLDTVIGLAVLHEYAIVDESPIKRTIDANLN